MIIVIVMHPAKTIPLILALDAGGSSTRCLLTRADGTVLAQARTGPGNHILSGWDVARTSITQAIAQVCTAAAAPVGTIDCAVAASAGVGSNGEGCEVIEALLTEIVPGVRVRAVGDMVAAFCGALASDFGVVVAAGTGSVCYGRNRTGASIQVGGWGQIMGDEGSAYDIAVRGLRAGARALDGRGPQTALLQRIGEALGASSFVEVAFRVYGEPMTREAIAGLATSVCKAAIDGDAIAIAILADAGVELGTAAVTALRSLGLADVDAPVACTGAVFDAGAFITEPFRRTVCAACPQAIIAAAVFPPVVGAFKIALREMQVAFTPETAAVLRAGFEEDHA